MIRIDDTLLEELGLISLPKEERDALLKQIYETLEMRVGMKLAERMSDQQLDEFERFIDTNDEAGALKWLETNFPDYKQVVADELEKLKGEIKQDSGKIVEAMKSQADHAQVAPVQQAYPATPSPANPGVVPPPPQQPPEFNAVTGNVSQVSQAPIQPQDTVVPPPPQQPPEFNAVTGNVSQAPQSQVPQQEPVVPPPFDQNQQPPQAA